MRPITLDTLGPLNMTNTCYVSPLPTVWNTQVHISTAYHSNETLHIEMLINDSFGLETILSVPDVDLDDSHIRFR